MSLPFLNWLFNSCTTIGITWCLVIVFHPYGFAQFAVFPALFLLFPFLVWMLLSGNKALYRKPLTARSRTSITAAMSVVSTAAVLFTVFLVVVSDGAWSTERHGRFSETELHVFTNPLIGWSGLLVLVCSWLALVVNTAEQRKYTFAVVLHILLLIVFSVLCIAVQGVERPMMDTHG